MKLYHINVKIYFLNDFIKEEVYVKQPPGFENYDFKLNKVVYGLKKTSRAWYGHLITFLIEHDFK